jgi:hypothetical protein
MSDSLKTQRRIIRWTHILCGIPMLGYIYTPPGETQYFAFQVRYVLVPLMLLAGLWMWKGHLLRRSMPRRRPADAAAGL